MPMSLSEKTEQRDFARGTLESMVLVRDPMYGYRLVEPIEQRSREPSPG
jgi:DNA-binding PadR family transcriptional regulator